MELVKGLAETLPTEFKVVWIEKNSHLNYSFNFPRYSVVTGHEHKAFIPYDGVSRGAPTGIVTRIQDTAVGLTEDQVLLASGDKIDYTYLAVATGASQPLPVQVSAMEHEDACNELQRVQETIHTSQTIAIVGAGAVGVELASDIKSFYPDKSVTLIHSRDQLLSHFGKRLQDYTLSVLRDELQIRVLLNERPKLPAGMARSACLTFSDGREKQFDLTVSNTSALASVCQPKSRIGCTGQRPNSSILATLYPSAISPKTSRILVWPTLQVIASDAPGLDIPIFALGDVADHGGPRMARAGGLQAWIVLDNILAIIHGQTPMRTYKPYGFVEGAIKLTLGQTHNVLYSMDADASGSMTGSRADLAPNSDFMVGGNSLLKMQLQGAIRETLGLTVPVTELYQASTLGGMVAHLHGEKGRQGPIKAIDWESETEFQPPSAGLCPTASRPVGEGNCEILLTGAHSTFVGTEVLQAFVGDSSIRRVHYVALPKTASKTVPRSSKIAWYPGQSP